MHWTVFILFFPCPFFAELMMLWTHMHTPTLCHRHICPTKTYMHTQQHTHTQNHTGNVQDGADLTCVDFLRGWVGESVFHSLPFDTFHSSLRSILYSCHSISPISLTKIYHSIKTYHSTQLLKLRLPIISPSPLISCHFKTFSVCRSLFSIPRLTINHSL